MHRVFTIGPLSEVCIEISRPYGSDLVQWFPHYSLFSWHSVCILCKWVDVNSYVVSLSFEC